MVRNIDDRKKKQQEINNLQKYLIDIIDSMPSVIIGTDKQLKITQWNKEATKLTNIQSLQAIGKKLADLKTNLPPILTEKTKRSIDSQQIVLLEKVEILINNRHDFFNITIYPVSARKRKGAVIRLDDITEKIQMEEMMIQSEKMLSVGGLAAGMAHEINNPLAGMMQNASVVLNRITKKSPKNIEVAKEYGIDLDKTLAFLKHRKIIKLLNLIHSSGQRAAKIITNMLSFARKSESNFSEVALTDVMDMAISLAQNDYDLKKKYDFRKIKIIKDYQPGLPKYYCDKSKLEQVFLNLLKNGAHAMSEVTSRQSTFNIRIYQQADDIKIEIEDNGPGIPENIKKRIFEPFFTTKEVGTGTGLGLSVSYFIITDNHNGKMYVESDTDAGTKFTIKLNLNNKNAQ